MKYTTLFLLLCASLGYAQDVAIVSDAIAFEKPVVQQLLTVSDFKLSDGRMLVTEIPCKIHFNNNVQTILVSVVCQQHAFNKFGVDMINDMIVVANEKVRHSLEPDSAYLPKEIKMAYFPDSRDWSLTTLFTVAGIDGVAKERLLAIDFDGNGKFAVMKKIL